MIKEAGSTLHLYGDILLNLPERLLDIMHSANKKISMYAINKKHYAFII